METLEITSPPPDPTDFEPTVEGSSPISPPLQTLDGLPSTDGSLPPTDVQTLNEPPFYPLLKNQQSPTLPITDAQPLNEISISPSSTLVGPSAFDAETLDFDDSDVHYLDAEIAGEDIASPPLSPSRKKNKKSSKSILDHWSKPWSTDTKNKPLVSPKYFDFDEVKPLVGAGLSNLGNTCFLNAVLQCFTHTVPLIQGLRSSSHATPCDRAIEDFCALCSLRDHIEFSLASSGRIVRPWGLVDKLSYISSSFCRYQQEDAHEFLQCFLDRLDSCLDPKSNDQSSSLKDDTIVKQVFGGRLISRLRCCNCGHCSDTYEPLIDLSLEIDNVDNLPSALESFTRVEKLEDPETKYTCDTCKEKVAVEKQFMLDQVPSVAAFHLKRFKNDGFFVEKIDKRVGFPLVLDLQPYTSGSEECNAELKYELYAVVVHIGYASTSGHYFSFVRSSPGTWYKLDDSEVTKVDEECVLAEEAYILFYAKQGTPWFSTIMEAQKQCSELNHHNISPKSVLDNVENTSPSYLSPANIYSYEVNKTSVDKTPSEGTSTQICFGLEHNDDDRKEAKVDKTPSAPCDEKLPSGNKTVNETPSAPCDEKSSNGDKIFTTSAVLENKRKQKMNEFMNNIQAHPQTTPRPTVNGVNSEVSPEAIFQTPRDLRSKSLSCKRNLDSFLEDPNKKEACRYMKNSNMSKKKQMMFMAAMHSGGSSPNKRNKKKSSPSSARRLRPVSA